MWQAWLTLPSCLASSSRPTLARMIFCSLVMTVVLVNAEAGRCAPRPLRAQHRLMPQTNNTVCQIKSKLLHVIQCKLYQSPVGNKAVQEAHAARSRYAADIAAVVTSRDFTPAARRLSATTGVLLVLHSE